MFILLGDTNNYLTGMVGRGYTDNYLRPLPLSMIKCNVDIHWTETNAQISIFLMRCYHIISKTYS